MPRAEKSLAQHLRTLETSPSTGEAIRILQDIATALSDIEPIAVHRDLKPANILKWGETWFLTDFGIARYAQEATGDVTWKGAHTPDYVAPEVLLGQAPTSASDVYSFGVIAYELLEGRTPFGGPETATQHLTAAPAAMATDSPHLRAMVTSCLAKKPALRPSPNQILQRLARAAEGPAEAGSVALARASARVSQHELEQEARAAREEQAKETRFARFENAREQLISVGDALMESLSRDAPSVRFETRGHSNRMLFVARLQDGSLGLSYPDPWFDSWKGTFEVICCATISVRSTTSRLGHTGRSHSLWYCDAQREGEFEWFETAFMTNTLFARETGQGPRALNPLEATDAFQHGVTNIQLARPFTAIDVVSPSAFIDPWLERFADAAVGELTAPTSLPEGIPNGSFR
jgi:serine/threonine-protein kinase